MADEPYAPAWEGSYACESIWRSEASGSAPAAWVACTCVAGQQHNALYEFVSIYSINSAVYTVAQDGYY